jgi:hypothetical protein
MVGDALFTAATDMENSSSVEPEDLDIASNAVQEIDGAAEKNARSMLSQPQSRTRPVVWESRVTMESVSADSFPGTEESSSSESESCI